MPPSNAHTSSNLPSLKGEEWFQLSESLPFSLHFTVQRSEIFESQGLLSNQPSRSSGTPCRPSYNKISRANALSVTEWAAAAAAVWLTSFISVSVAAVSTFTAGRKMRGEERIERAGQKYTLCKASKILPCLRRFHFCYWLENKPIANCLSDDCWMFLTVRSDRVRWCHCKTSEGERRVCMPLM